MILRRLQVERQKIFGFLHALLNYREMYVVKVFCYAKLY